MWTEFFARHQEAFEWVAPTAGLVALVRLRGWLIQQGTATELCRRALDYGGVFLLPGPMFAYDEEHVRVGFARRGLKEGLDKFEAFLEVAKNNGN